MSRFVLKTSLTAVVIALIIAVASYVKPDAHSSDADGRHRAPANLHTVSADDAEILLAKVVPYYGEGRRGYGRARNHYSRRRVRRLVGPYRAARSRRYRTQGRYKSRRKYRRGRSYWEI